MESITMYNDLPAINVVHRESSGCLENQWSMNPRHYYTDWPRDIGGMPSWSTSHAQQMPILDGPACQDHLKVSSWLPRVVKQEILGIQQPHSFEDLGAPAWKPWTAFRTCFSSDAEESLGSDQVSLGSSWNPEDSEDYSVRKVMEEEHMTNLKRGFETLRSWSCGNLNINYSNPAAPITSSKTERPDLGVTLQDVQQFADDCATNSDNDSMSVTECDDQGLIVECLSNVENTLLDTHPPLSRQDLDQRLENGLQNSCNEIYSPNPPSHNFESDDDPDYQDQPSRSQRCTGKRMRPASASKQFEKSTILALSRVSKRRSKQPLKRTTNNTETSDRSMRSSCHDCEFEAASKSALRKHTLTVHIRPFTCSFRIYGCPATFGSKNEWKRHVSSQHLRLGFWRCDLDGCLPSKGPQNKASGSAKKSTRACSEEVVTYNDFNRKDLFTQHLRRMHAPGRGASKTNRDSFNHSLAATCTRCWISLRSPPVFGTCGFCDQDEPFKGDDLCKLATWETRMEHVGRHLEIGHGKSRVWQEDMVLRDWMSENGLIQQSKNGIWTLTGLQRGKGKVPRIAI